MSDEQNNDPRLSEKLVNLFRPREDFMRHLRWITPLLLTAMLWMATQILTEIRNIRAEYVSYTNAMIDRAMKYPHPESVTKTEFREFKQDVKSEFREVKDLIQSQ